MNALDEKLSRAKALLILQNPFVASIVCGMKIEVDASLDPPTLATNGVYIKAHPAWIDAHTKGELQWALGHETFHNVLQHCIGGRAAGRNLDKWNIAGDVVINCMLEGANGPGMRLGQRPKNIIWDASPMLGGKSALELYALGKTTEGVYALLPDPPKNGGGKGGGLWDRAEPFNGDAAQTAELEAKWKVKVAQAAASAKMCGMLSSELAQLVNDVLKPRVAWTDKMRQFFTKRAKVTRSYARPNRRFMSQDLYLPSKNGHVLGDVLVAVDLSGSVTPRELQEFVAELRAIKEDCQPSCVHVLYFTSQVVGYEKFERYEELDLHPNGTGGTAFSPIFRYAETHDIRPEACVVLTDLCCNDFGPPPDYPVMWASTGQGSAPWGEVIMLREQHV